MSGQEPGRAQVRLLPEPDRPYAALRDDLVRLDWEWANESQQLPTLPGEPEWVRYRHPSGAVLEYEFLPPVALRTVVARGGPDVLAPLGGLPHLDGTDLAALLEEADDEMVVRGLLGVQALVWVPLLGQVRELASTHPEALIRQVAQDVAARLPALATADFDRWRALRESRPGRSILLALMVAEDRRQVVRWIGRERSATAGALEALRTGLADDDAEVRATAVVVAARLGAREVTADVDGVAVPEQLTGPVRLASERLRSGRPLHVAEPHDDESLLLFSLAEPVVDVPPPDRLPAHLLEESGVRLAKSGVPVVLVPSVQHWLWGEGDGRLHSIRPEAFVMTSAPVDVGTARQLGIASVGADADPLLATEAMARELAAHLSAHEGVPLEVVDSRRWEAALRGPDGRRFTAGNVAPEVAVSPWGALAVPGVRERLSGGLAADPADLGVMWSADPDERLPVRLAMRFPL
jgi:hypothetical protein